MFHLTHYNIMENKYTRLKWLALIIITGFLLFLAQSAFAVNKLLIITSFPQQQITGKVTDQVGLPLIGVTVMVKGSNTGTITNLEGIYNLPVAENSTLIFSYIGYKTLEVPFKGEKEVDVQLEEDISSLDEVQINAGYYNTTRRESTGNISRVTAEEIELQPVVSPLQALQGRMAGVEIVSRGNLPGSAPTIRIRGTNSLRDEGNLPLYIIDGVPINSAPLNSFNNLQAVGIDPLNTLNLSNIESIEILKDADATAIYGSRGANGVVLITTKKGKDGKMDIETRLYTGASQVANRLDLLNTDEYLRVRERAFENDGIEPTERNAYDLLIWDPDRYTDWQDLFFGGTSPVTDININATGGNENTSIRLNGSFHTQGTVYIGDYNYTKVTAGAQISHTSENEKLKLDLAVNYGVDNNKMAGFLDLTIPAFRLPPNAPSIFNENGSLNWEDWSTVGLDNPLSGFYNNSLTRSNSLISNLLVSYQIAKGLRLKSNFGYTNFQSDEVVNRPKRSNNPSSWESLNNRSNHLFIKRNSWIIEPQLTYSSEIGKGNIDAIIGGTYQQSERSDLALQGEGYVSESLIGNLSAAENIITLSNQNADYRYNALFARLGFNWGRKYYLNLTGRRDGSSRFGSNNRFANFGAIGGAWIFSEEAFIEKNLPFLSFAKLRGSYGTTGSDQIGDYGYLDAYETTIGPRGLYPSQLSNPDYSWEIVKKLEAALEFGFLKDRINFGLSLYRNRSSNQLVGFSLPAITGFTSVQANLPATVENTGLEIEFSSYNFQSDDFRWQTSFNLTFPRNQLINYPGIEQSSYANTYRVGEPLNISLLYEYQGINAETGLYNVVDVNSDGRIDFNDRLIPWDRGRKYFGGFNNTLSYKNFSLNFLFEFVKQEGMLTLFNAGALEMQRSEVLKALEGTSEYQQSSTSIAASRAYNEVLNSNFAIVDASFLRLKTLNLGYTLPAQILQSVGIKSGQIFLNGLNLLTFTPYEGMDPEQPGRGTSFAGYRTITGGFQLNF